MHHGRLMRGPDHKRQNVSRHERACTSTTSRGNQRHGCEHFDQHACLSIPRLRDLPHGNLYLVRLDTGTDIRVRRAGSRGLITTRQVATTGVCYYSSTNVAENTLKRGRSHDGDQFAGCKFPRKPGTSSRASELTVPVAIREPWDAKYKRKTNQ